MGEAALKMEPGVMGPPSDGQTTSAGPSYKIGKANDAQYIWCSLCDMTSWHPEDVLRRYCGSCHIFHSVVGHAVDCLKDGNGKLAGELIDQFNGRLVQDPRCDRLWELLKLPKQQCSCGQCWLGGPTAPFLCIECDRYEWHCNAICDRCHDKALDEASEEDDEGFNFMVAALVLAIAFGFWLGATWVQWTGG